MPHFNQTWQDLQDERESFAIKSMAFVIGAICITAPIIYGIILHTN